MVVFQNGGIYEHFKMEIFQNGGISEWRYLRMEVFQDRSI